MGLFDSVFDLTKDVLKVASAPITMVVDLAGAAVKPLAEVADELTNEIKSLKD
jgi:hypothetical protein